MSDRTGAHPTDASPPRWRWLALAAAALLPYGHTLDYSFINLDDAHAIVNLPLIRELSWSAVSRIFTPDIYSGLPEYMPLKNLSYALDYALFGLSAPGFRIQQLFWYLLSVLLAYAWLRRLLLTLAHRGRLELEPRISEWIAWGASVLFAIHPVHVESVTWLSGRKDVLAGAFMFGCLWAALRASIERDRAPAAPVRVASWAALAIACAGLALLSKPTAVALAPLLLVQELSIVPSEPRARKLRLWRAWLTVHLPVWLLVGAFGTLYLRLVSAHASARGDLAEIAPVVRIGQQLALALKLALAPSELVPIVPPSWFDPAAASVPALLGYAVCITLLLAAVSGIRAPHGGRLIALAAVCVFVLPLLPSLVRPVWGQLSAGRYLYHSVLGPALLCSWACAALIGRFGRLRVVALTAAVVIGLLWTGATVAYNHAFRTSEALWRHAISIEPTFARFYELAAGDALARGDGPGALRWFERCVEVTAGAPECAAPLGGLMLLFDPPRGEAMLRAVLPRDRDGVAHRRLAQHWASQGRAREGLALYERWLAGRPAGPAEIGAVVELAVAAEQPAKASHYLRQLAVSAAMTQPASPPPSAAVIRGAEQAADDELLTRARAAAARCRRSDCFAAALGSP